MNAEVPQRVGGVAGLLALLHQLDILSAMCDLVLTTLAHVLQEKEPRVAVGLVEIVETRIGPQRRVLSADDWSEYVRQGRTTFTQDRG